MAQKIQCQCPLGVAPRLTSWWFQSIIAGFLSKPWAKISFLLLDKLLAKQKGTQYIGHNISDISDTRYQIFCCLFSLPPPHWLSLCHIKAHLQRPRPCTFHKWQNLSTDKIPAVKSANVNCFSSSNLDPLTAGAFKYERINAASWGIFQPSTLPPDSVVRGERSGGSRQTRLSHPRARDRKGRRPSSQVPTIVI